MKRLLLLFFLSPVILFAQTQRRQVIDSDKDDAAINLQSISALMGNNPCTRVANIRITHNFTDSGEYVSTVVFFHILTALDSAGFDTITALPPLAVTKINTADIPVGKVEPVTTLPHLPIIKDDALTALLPLGIVKINTESVPVGEVGIVTTFPPLPVVIVDEKALSLHPIVTINTEDIPFGKVEIVTTFPPLPIIKDDSMTVLLPLAIVEINTADIPVGTVEIITPLPPLPAIISDVIEDLQPLSAVTLNIADIPAGKVVVIDSIPDLELKRTPVEGMHLSQEGYSLLEKLEGFSDGLYSLNDGGYTIGFGFFVPYNEASKWRNGVTLEQAERLIQEKVPAYEDQVKEFINVPLTQREFDALTMLAYNLGGFAKATSIVNDINNQEDFDKLQADWKRFVHSKAPNVSKGLMNRRKDELDVREKSEYQPERKIQILKSRK